VSHQLRFIVPNNISNDKEIESFVKVRKMYYIA